MEIQWGKNPEYTLCAWINLKDWAFPVHITWRSNDGCSLSKMITNDVENYKCLSMHLGILCFGFSLEIWKWSKEMNNEKLL